MNFDPLIHFLNLASFNLHDVWWLFILKFLFWYQIGRLVKGCIFWVITLGKRT